MKKNAKKLVVFLALVTVLTAVLCFNSSASINWGTGVYISYKGQVVDSITYNGVKVDAVYAPRSQVAGYDSDATYCCAAFVSKFYRNVFGVNVSNLYPGNQPNASSGYFYKVTTPQVGDIAGSSGHWAIVKSVSGSTVNLIEQNAWYDNAMTKAAVGRKINLPESSYWYWRWSGVGNAPAPSYFTGLWSSDISNTNATLHATINKTYIDTCGFYLGTSQNNMKLIKDESAYKNVINIWFNLNEYGVTLTPGTKYYFKIYIKVGGKEYATEVQSFTTTGHTHSYKDIIEPATIIQSGTLTKKCDCGQVYSKSVISSPKNFALTSASYVYDGKVKTPAVSIKDSNNKVLVNGTDYTLTYESGRKLPGKYSVKVTFKGKYSGSAYLNFKIAPAVTSKINVVQTTNAIKLAWNKVPGATGYRVYIYNAKTKKYQSLKTLTGNSYLIKNLNPGTAYTFKVRAYTTDGEVIWGNPTAAFATATKTNTPNLKVVSTKKGVATLTWSSVAGESGYQVYYSTKKDSGFKFYKNFSSNTTGGLVTSLTSGKGYYFTVRTYKKTANGYVFSDWSPIRGVKVK